jgi:hypothetical protein
MTNVQPICREIVFKEKITDMKKLMIFSSLLFILVVPGISQKRVIYKPVSEDLYYDHGIPYLKFHTQNANVEISFDGKFETYAVFDIYVSNISKDKLLVDPADFTMKPADYSLTDSLKGYDSHAIDPDKKASVLRKNYHQSRNEYAAIKGTGLFLDFLLLGAEIASAGHGYHHRNERAAALIGLMAGREVIRAATDINYGVKMEDISRQLDLWEKDALRLTTLDPDRSVHGKIVFKDININSYYTLLFPLGTETVKASFRRQEK